jgi:hypothetical protein
MSEELGIIRECRNIVCGLRAKIDRVRTHHLNRDDLKGEVREVVDGYFRSDRPILLKRFRDEAIFAPIDEAMQELLRFAQRRTTVSRYGVLLNQLEHTWADLEVNTIKLFGDLTVGEVAELTPHEHAILETLKKLLPSAAASYQQVLEDLGVDQKLSWRGTAAELREALREVLDHLAPDAEVKASPGFKLEQGASGPTMKQKTRFILRSRRRSENARATVEDAVEVVEEKVGALVRSVYSRSSGTVHAGATKAEVLSAKRFVDTVLAELLEIG